MVAKAMKDVSEVVRHHYGLSRTVLQYSLVMKHLVDAAKKPGFTQDSWVPLAKFVAIDEFERVGNFLEVMTWRDYITFLTKWAKSSEWECSFKRVSESDRVVFLELEERSRVGEHTSVVNSCSIYEFNDLGRLRHLDVYLQMKPVPREMLAAYG